MNTYTVTRYMRGNLDFLNELMRLTPMSHQDLKEVLTTHDNYINLFPIPEIPLHYIVSTKECKYEVACLDEAATKELLYLVTLLNNRVPLPDNVVPFRRMRLARSGRTPPKVGGR